MAPRENRSSRPQAEFQDELARLDPQVLPRRDAPGLLADLECRYRTVFDVLQVGLVVHGPDGAIIGANPAAARILGIPPAGLVGLTPTGYPWNAVYESGAPFPATLQPIMRTLEDGLPRHDVILGLPRQDGSHTWLSINTAPLVVPEDGPLAGVVVSFIDVTALKCTEQRLRDTERWLKEAQKVAHVGSWTHDLASGDVEWSDEVYRIHGVPPGTLGNDWRAVFRYLRPEERDQAIAAAERALAEERPADAEFRIIRPDGEERVVHVRSDFVRDADGRVLKVIGTVQDVTATKQAQAEIALRTAELAKARELDALKTNLVDAVSHELRTPLTSIKGYAEFLEDDIAGALNEGQRAYLAQIQAGAQRLERLVDDLLDFARLEAGKFKLEPQPCDLGAIARRAAESLAPQARQAHLRLEVQAPEQPVSVRCDSKRIEQVLLNLLGNAIKFTPAQGRVEVRIEPAGPPDGAEGAPFVRAWVCDTGIGIAPEHLAHLFDKFYQVDHSSTRERGGAGLGLSIARALVAEHGGEIGVDSTPGQGTCFWFTLPVAPPGQAPCEQAG